MIFDGSRVSLQPGALQSTSEYDGARANVLYYDAAKNRYALQLIHPDFQGKRLLCRKEALEFHFATLPENLQAAKAELRQKSISFQDCDTFLAKTSAPKAAASNAPNAPSNSRLGKALVATKRFEAGDVVLVDKPFLVVANPDSLERWVNRWDCYFEMMKLNQGGHGELLEAFEAMDDGGRAVVASLEDAALDTLRLMWQSAGAMVTVPEAKKEKDKLKVAGGFARWQTNQHEFPALWQRPKRRALYWLAPKVAHSCNPNVGWEDPDEDGTVELRALRAIDPQEVLGVNYMDADFLLESRELRQRRLLEERKFHCVCDRCLDQPIASYPVSAPPKAAVPAAAPDRLAPADRPAVSVSSSMLIPFLQSLEAHLRVGKLKESLAALALLGLDDTEARAEGGEDGSLKVLAEALRKKLLPGESSSDTFDSLD